MRTVKPLMFGVLATAMSLSACARNRSNDASASPRDDDAASGAGNTEMLSDPEDNSIPASGQSGTQDDDIRLRSATLPADRPVTVEFRFLDEEDRMDGGQAGK